MIEREILPGIQKHLSSRFIREDLDLWIQFYNLIETVNMVEMSMSQKYNVYIFEFFPIIPRIN